MKIVHEMSFGIVPVCKKGAGIYEFCLVQYAAGHWGIPKGHREGLETKEQTARRELFEETGIGSIDILPHITLSEKYSFVKNGSTHHKNVLYFVGMVDPLNTKGLTRVAGEIIGKEWLSYKDALKRLTYAESKDILKKAYEYVVRVV